MAHVTHVRRTSDDDDDDDVIARLRSNHFDPPGGGLTLPRLPLRVIWVGPDRQAPPPQVVSLQEALILFLRSSQPRRTPVLLGYVSILFIIYHIVTFSSSIVQNISCTQTTAAVKGTNVPRVVEHY